MKKERDDSEKALKKKHKDQIDKLTTSKDQDCAKEKADFKQKFNSKYEKDMVKLTKDLN